MKNSGANTFCQSSARPCTHKPGGVMRLKQCLLCSYSNRLRAAAQYVAMGQARKSLDHSTGSRRQVVEQRLGLFQIERVEPFSEPAVNRSQQITCRGAFALIPPEAGKARRCPELK